MTKKYKLSILLLTALLGACNLLEPVGDPCHSERSEESLVPVALTLDVAAAEDGMPGSKADIYYEPEDPTRTQPSRPSCCCSSTARTRTRS